jgi:DNA repair photolyase
LRMTRMFDFVTETWNPITGCSHECVYCWARRLESPAGCRGGEKEEERRKKEGGG